MNLKGKLSTNLSLTANTSIPKVVHEGGASTWNEITGKPFSTVDTEGGLTIYDNTLGIDTLDTIATINYVNQAISGITPTVEIDNKSIVTNWKGELQLDVPFGSWPDVIYGWKPEFEYNGSAWVHTLTQDEKNYCSNELIPALLHFTRLIIIWSVGTYGEYTDYTVTQDGTTVTISLDAYHSLVISADDMTVTGYAPIGFDLLIEESGFTLEQYNIEVGEIETERRIHKIPSEYYDKTAVQVTQTLLTGTAIADIDVDGTTTTLYAPGGGGNWNATSGQDGFIQNKPSIWSGTGSNSIIEGMQTSASGDYSHAEGYISEATATGAHAEGQSKASGSYAHSEGANTRAAGSYSHSEGSNTFAYSSEQHVQGRFNIADSNDVFADIIGNGTLTGSRSNAEATDWSGNKYLAGDVYTHVTDWTDPQNNSIKLANIPEPPTTDGTYTLQATVSNRSTTYSWI